MCGAVGGRRAEGSRSLWCWRVEKRSWRPREVGGWGLALQGGFPPGKERGGRRGEAERKEKGRNDHTIAANLNVRAFRKLKEDIFLISGRS